MPVVCLNIFGNIHIFIIVKKHKKKIRNLTNLTADTSPAHNAKGLVTIAIGTAAVILTWAPILIIRALDGMGIAVIPHFITFLTMMCLFCNSFSNWIIYTKTHRPFWKDQIDVWKRFVVFLNKK